MDYFKAAFGGFAPQCDEDAAVKFAMNVVLMDNRVQELAELVVDGSKFGGIEGEPGWMLERRDVADEGNEAAYPGWPAGACFMASVEAGSYKLQHPVFFMTREVFMKYLLPAIDAYVATDPSRATAPAVVASQGDCISAQTRSRLRCPAFTDTTTKIIFLFNKNKGRIMRSRSGPVKRSTL